MEPIATKDTLSLVSQNDFPSQILYKVNIVNPDIPDERESETKGQNRSFATTANLKTFQFTHSTKDKELWCPVKLQT